MPVTVHTINPGDFRRLHELAGAVPPRGPRGSLQNLRRGLALRLLTAHCHSMGLTLEQGYALLHDTGGTHA